MIYRYFISFILIIITTQVVGQNESILITHATDNSILLRWGGGDNYTTTLLINEGVNIERVTIKRDGKLLKEPIKKILNGFPVKTLDSNNPKWNDTTDNYLQIARSILFDRDKEVEIDNSNVKNSLLQSQNNKEMSFGFLLLATEFSQKAAKYTGLFFEDNTAKQNEEYLYKILPLNKKVKPSFTVNSFKEKNNFIRLKKPSFERKNKRVSLIFNVKDANYSGYIIEKSLNNKSFEQINDVPVVPLNTIENPIVKYDDTLVDYDKTYYYRVRGINSFALNSPPTSSIEIEVYKQLTKAPIIKEFTPKNSSVSLLWEWESEDKERASELVLKRASKANGSYSVVSKKLFNKQVTIDKKPLPVNYYILVAKNKYGDSVVSNPILVQFEDKIPPAKPIILKGASDSNGIVTLEWKQNLDNDIYGYRVFKANNINQEFSQITVGACQDTFYLDTVSLNNLNNSIYYKIVALDFHYNPSVFSEPIEIVKPDTIPPTSPLFKSYQTNEYGIQLSWINSSSSDVVKHKLMRLENDKWTTVKTFKNNTTAYFDSLETENEVIYNIIAFDQSDNQTAAHKKLKVTKKKTSFINKKPQLEILKEESKHVLIWEENIPNVEAIVIYKLKNNEPMREYQIVKDTHFLEEKEIAIGETYTYLIKYIYNNGKESIYSDKKTVLW